MKTYIKSTLHYTPQTIKRASRIVWGGVAVFFIANACMIAITTLSLAEYQRLTRSIQVLSSEVSTAELAYLEKEQSLSSEEFSTYNLIPVSTVAFSQKSANVALRIGEYGE